MASLGTLSNELKHELFRYWADLDTVPTRAVPLDSTHVSITPLPAQNTALLADETYMIWLNRMHRSRTVDLVYTGPEQKAPHHCVKVLPPQGFPGVQYTYGQSTVAKVTVRIEAEPTAFAFRFPKHESNYIVTMDELTKYCALIGSGACGALPTASLGTSQGLRVPPSRYHANFDGLWNGNHPIYDAFGREMSWSIPEQGFVEELLFGAFHPLTLLVCYDAKSSVRVSGAKVIPRPNLSEDSPRESCVPPNVKSGWQRTRRGRFEEWVPIPSTVAPVPGHNDPMHQWLDKRVQFLKTHHDWAVSNYSVVAKMGANAEGHLARKIDTYFLLQIADAAALIYSAVSRLGSDQCPVSIRRRIGELLMRSSTAFSIQARRDCHISWVRFRPSDYNGSCSIDACPCWHLTGLLDEDQERMLQGCSKKFRAWNAERLGDLGFSPVVLGHYLHVVAICHYMPRGLSAYNIPDCVQQLDRIRQWLDTRSERGGVTVLQILKRDRETLNKLYENWGAINDAPVRASALLHEVCNDYPDLDAVVEAALAYENPNRFIEYNST